MYYNSQNAGESKVARDVVFQNFRLSSTLVSDESDDHGVKVEEEHEQVEAELDE